VAYVGDGETLRQVGHRMRELGVAALPGCAGDGRLQGHVTRDVVERIAAGGDPNTVAVGGVASYAPVPSGAARQAVAALDASEGVWP